MNKRSHRLFIRRTLNVWHTQKRKPGPLGSQLTLDQLRGMVKAQQQCPYCYTVITPRNFSMDHRVPLSRGGLHDIANVTICCKACNTAKGQLTDQEYAKLLHFLCTNYIQAAQRDILARLKAGARRFMRKAA